MQITFNRRTALAILRALRARASFDCALANRSNVASPSPFPKKRWSKKLFETIDFGLPLSLKGSPVDVAVPDQAKRLGTKIVFNTTYGSSIPADSFLDLGNGITISSPELLFAEMAPLMNPVEHLMLGHELCGSFCRDATDPYNGPITYGVEPATSVERIRAFLDESSYIHGIAEARSTLNYLNDNAWSPTESLVAALLRLPFDSLGYDLGELTLNPRTYASYVLPGAKESRVPDVLVKGTPVGVNYDGLVHLDLDSVVKAALDVGLHPEVSQTQEILDRTVQSVRAKAVDDIKRNRELAADGLFVFPVVKEDLYTPGGLDQVVSLLLDAIEQYAKADMSEQRKMLSNKTLSQERHRVILSLLPGRSERGIQIGRFIYGHKVIEGPQTISEYWIEL